jgi:IS6 family transposase
VSIFSGRHFPKEVILWAVRWYCRYGVSYRDLEEMLTERGVAVDHTTIYRWVQRYAPELDKQTRWYRRVGQWAAQSWRVDETYLRIGGKWCYLVCPGSCDGLAGESPAGVAAKRPRS